MFNVWAIVDSKFPHIDVSQTSMQYRRIRMISNCCGSEDLCHLGCSYIFGIYLSSTLENWSHDDPMIGDDEQGMEFE